MCKKFQNENRMCDCRDICIFTSENIPHVNHVKFLFKAFLGMLFPLSTPLTGDREFFFFGFNLPWVGTFVSQ